MSILSSSTNLDLRIPDLKYLLPDLENLATRSKEADFMTKAWPGIKEWLCTTLGIPAEFTSPNCDLFDIAIHPGRFNSCIFHQRIHGHVIIGDQANSRPIRWQLNLSPEAEGFRTSLDPFPKITAEICTSKLRELAGKIGRHSLMIAGRLTDNRMITAISYDPMPRPDSILIQTAQDEGPPQKHLVNQIKVDFSTRTICLQIVLADERKTQLVIPPFIAEKPRYAIFDNRDIIAF